MKKFLVLIERKPTFTGSCLQGHREFLHRGKEAQSLLTAGGFVDQTGGAYVLLADSLEEAEKMAGQDPMNHENECVYTIKEWNAN